MYVMNSYIWPVYENSRTLSGVIEYKYMITHTSKAKCTKQLRIQLNLQVKTCCMYVSAMPHNVAPERIINFIISSSNNKNWHILQYIIIAWVWIELCHLTAVASAVGALEYTYEHNIQHTIMLRHINSCQELMHIHTNLTTHTFLHMHLYICSYLKVNC